MVDLKEQCLLVPGDEENMLHNTSKSSPSQGSSESMKSCTGCHTTTTPLWRGGPAGPKTLCNACGIKYHKKRRALLGLESGKIDKSKSKKKIRSSSSTTSRSSSSSGSAGEEKPSFRMPLKIKIHKFNGGGADFLGRKLGEEEQAAMLLMALSCGSVYA